VKSRDNVRFRLKVRRAEAFYEDETVLMGRPFSWIFLIHPKASIFFQIQVITLVFSRRFRWPGRCTPKVNSFL
jgi:hypothetical protein